jgi:cellulose synthase/poly-beta-1,6-N-acetylglucosamine synthase-like glycosyltransferase
MIRDYIIPSIFAYIGANSLALGGSLYLSQYGEVRKPNGKVSIILPSLSIDKYLINKVMGSIFKSNVVIEYPDSFEYILVTDPYFDDVDDFNYFDKIIKAPLGKLTARDIAIRQASGDIIVAIDVDRVYNRNWLNEMIKPFNDSNVVGTTSFIIYHFITTPFNTIPKLFWYANKMDGGGSAFRKDAYLKIGGFNLNINQLDWKWMIQEEEVLFKKRLEQVGKVVFVPVPSYAVTRQSAPERLRETNKSL